MLGIEIAKKFIGLHERTNNSELRALLKSQAINGDIVIDPATTSWCAAWVNFCERESGHKGNGHLNAQSFKTYGQPVASIDDAQYGDILVFHFNFDTDWQGHVTYFSKFNDDGSVECLGGNQSDEVRYSNYDPDSVTNVRRSV